METRILLAGGGTAGHTSPLLAVSEALAALGVDGFVFIGGRRGLENRLIPERGIEYHRTLMPSLRDPESRLSLVAAAAALPLAVLQAWWFIARSRPRAALTSGGLVSLPVVLAASIRGVPVVIWNGDAIPGRVNRLLARFARRVASTFPEEERFFPKGKVVVTGNPIRPEDVRWTAGDARARLGLPADERVVLVTGGSQGSAAVNGALDGALTRILPKAHVLHVAGDAHLARAKARQASLPAAVGDRYHVFGFTREMAAMLAACDLVVGRAGSGSIAGALAIGRPMVLIPLGVAASGHQMANARSVVDTGAALLVRESELDGDRLAAVVIGLLDDPDRLARMRHAAAKAGRPDAAVRIAKLVLELVAPKAPARDHRPMAERRP